MGMSRRGWIGRAAVSLVGLVFRPRSVEARSPRFAGSPTIRFLGDWGDAEPAVTAELCTLAMDEALAHLTPGEIAGLPRVLRVVPDPRGPFAALAPPAEASVTLHLSVRDRHWAQCLFQFGHELGHVLANYRRVDFRTNPHQWLEEACCGALTLFLLERLAVTLRAVPEDPWRALASELGPYARDRRREYDRDGVVVNPRVWLARNMADLTAARGLVFPATALVSWLEARFRDEPGLIGSLRYLNLWSPSEVGSLAAHLERWAQRAAPGRGGLPSLLRREFGLKG